MLDSIYLILTGLATALSKESECHFSASAETVCFGGVGQPLIFHLSTRANTSLVLIKDHKYRILRVYDDERVMIDQKYIKQEKCIDNGTLKLGDATKPHSGHYSLEEFGTDGRLLRKVNLHLEIQAPVSKPTVSQMCLSPEQMQVICSSVGDEVEFILILDGQVLLQSRDQSQLWSNSTTKKSIYSVVPVNVHGKKTGNLMCHVWNNVSKEQTVIHLTACEDPTYHIYVEVVRASVAVLLLVVLCLSIYWVHKKTRAMTVTEVWAAETEMTTRPRLNKRCEPERQRSQPGSTWTPSKV